MFQEYLECPMMAVILDIRDEAPSIQQFWLHFNILADGNERHAFLSCASGPLGPSLSFDNAFGAYSMTSGSVTTFMVGSVPTNVCSSVYGQQGAALTLLLSSVQYHKAKQAILDFISSGQHADYRSVIAAFHSLAVSMGLFAPPPPMIQDFAQSSGYVTEIIRRNPQDEVIYGFWRSSSAAPMELELRVSDQNCLIRHFYIFNGSRNFDVACQINRVGSSSIIFRTNDDALVERYSLGVRGAEAAALRAYGLRPSILELQRVGPSLLQAKWRSPTWVWDGVNLSNVRQASDVMPMSFEFRR
jgi:hypothetical protein